MKRDKYIGMDVHSAMTVIAVLSAAGKVLAEAIIETKASTILDFIKSQRGTLWVTFEEGTQAAWLYDQGRPCGREANTAKFLAAEAGFLAADQAVQTHGGLGYAREYHVERYFREARLLRIVPVSQEMVLNYLGHHVLGLPKAY